MAALGADRDPVVVRDVSDTDQLHVGLERDGVRDAAGSTSLRFLLGWCGAVMG